ncbi:MAG: hypothetical protein RLY93_09135 [Sumerlaeia bacterium]
MPPVSYSDIKKGRRREWDPLLPPDERRRREDEARAAKQEATAKYKSFLKRRQENLEKQRQDDEVKFRQVMRQVTIAGVILGALLLLYGGYSAYRSIQAERARSGKLVEYSRQMDSGFEFSSLDDPIEAWASWRSAWLKKNAQGLFDTYGPDLRRQVLDSTGSNEYVRYQQQRFRTGLLDTDISLARGFDSPKYLHQPTRPYSDGELAVFVSRPISRAETREKPRPWIAAFVYQDADDTWRFQEVRPLSQWRESWDHANQVAPQAISLEKLRGG